MMTPTDRDLVFEDFNPPRRPLRIAIVTETYPPEVNGVALSLARLVDGLNARGHAVQLVRPRQSAGGAQLAVGLEEVLTRGLPIPNYPSLRMGVPSKRALIRLWRVRRPDVVHVATEGPLGWSATQAARHLMLPTASDFRTNFHAYGQHYGLGWLARPIVGYLRKFHNACDFTAVPTEALRVDLTMRGFERLQVVGRGVDTQRFCPDRRSSALRSSWRVDDESPVLLSVGRLASEKNLGLVVSTFETLRASNPRARLVFVGEGPAAEALRARAPDAIFAGQRSGEDLAAHYASADVFLFPSVTETFGNVTLEAMASGLAVVAYPLAAAAQLIESNRNGVLAERCTDISFIQAAHRPLADPAFRVQLGSAARQTALSRGWDAVVCQMEKHWLELVDAQSRTHVVSGPADSGRLASAV